MSQSNSVASSSSRRTIRRNQGEDAHELVLFEQQPPTVAQRCSECCYGASNTSVIDYIKEYLFGNSGNR